MSKIFMKNILNNSDLKKKYIFGTLANLNIFPLEWSLAETVMCCTHLSCGRLRGRCISWALSGSQSNYAWGLRCCSVRDIEY